MFNNHYTYFLLVPKCASLILILVNYTPLKGFPLIENAISISEIEKIDSINAFEILKSID